ncbi:MAG: glycosyltransferase [Christensenellales bacterium]|jgi:glycosyltransferase involved in cell wall biosynthesis
MSCPLSIIVPVFQAERFLEKCINSILNQSFTRFQLILVNDGSTDASGDICERAARKDKRITILHQQNLGVAKAVKNALAYAEGKYIGFVDSDDFIDRDMYAKLMEKADLCDIIACAWNEVRDDKVMPAPLALPSGYYDKNKIEKLIYPTLMEGEGDIEYAALKISRVNKIYKRELILDNLSYYKEDIKDSEDYSFYLAVMLDARSVYVLQNEYLYNYVIHKNSTTAKPDKNYWAESLACIRNLHSISQAKGKTFLAPRIDLLAARFATVALARSAALQKREALERAKEILSAPEVKRGLAIPSKSKDSRVRLLLALMRKGKTGAIYALSRLYKLIKS